MSAGTKTDRAGLEPATSRITRFHGLWGLLVFVAMGCATTASHGPVEAAGESASEPAGTPAQAVLPAADGWLAMRQGDVSGARAAFEAMRRKPDTALEGRAGLLRIAQIERDEELARELLAEIPEEPGAFFEVTAAQTALSFGLETPELLARACEHREDYRIGSDAKGICARAALHARHPEQIRCIKGCDRSHQWPLAMVGAAPVVMASVAGAKPVPFIVDTGASSAVLARAFAEAQGVEAVEGTRFEVSSSGGGVETALAVADVAIGELVKADVPFLILDLPLEGIAGILSPQALFEEFVVAADFGASMTLSLFHQAEAAVYDGVEVFDLYLDQGVVQLVASLGERPPRPLLLDTGADRTRLTAELDAKATDLERGQETVALSAGGTVKTWQTRGRLEGRAGDLVWTVENPLVYEPGRPLSAARMHWQGMLGMDFLMGRRLVLDLPANKLAISHVAELAAWPVDSRFAVEVDGTLLDGPVVVEEVVEAHDGKEVTLGVTITHADRQERFRIRMRDSWESRGTWLLTRPIEAYWVVEDGEFVERPVESGLESWRQVFSPFQLSGRPSVSVETLDSPDGSLQCSKLEAPARAFGAKPEQALFRIWECPGPWRARRLELTTIDGKELLWGFEETMTRR